MLSFKSEQEIDFKTSRQQNSFRMKIGVSVVISVLPQIVTQTETQTQNMIFI